MYRLVVSILQPYVLLHVAFGTGLMWLWRRHAGRKPALALVSVAWGVLLVLSLPIVSYLMLGTLEWQFPPENGVPSDVEAIVVLGGGTEPADQWQPEERPTSTTFSDRKSVV